MCTGGVYQCKSSIRSLRSLANMFERNSIHVPSLLIPWRRIRRRSDVNSWKRYIPQQKSPRKDKYVGCPRGDGKSVGITERFPWPVAWAQTGYTFLYPKRRFFWKFDPLVETFLECDTMWREPPPGHVFLESLAEIDGRKVVEVVQVVSRLPDKNNASATHFFARSPNPIARFRWKRARLSLFRPKPHLPSFIQIRPSVLDLLAKTTFQMLQ